MNLGLAALGLVIMVAVLFVVIGLTAALLADMVPMALGVFVVRMVGTVCILVPLGAQVTFGQQTLARMIVPPEDFQLAVEHPLLLERRQPSHLHFARHPDLNWG